MRSFMEPAAKATDAGGTDQLSARELEILALLAEGCPNKEIASRLCISSATVRTHLMQAAGFMVARLRGKNLEPAWTKKDKDGKETGKYSACAEVCPTGATLFGRVVTA